MDVQLVSSQLSSLAKSDGDGNSEWLSCQLPSGAFVVDAEKSTTFPVLAMNTSGEIVAERVLHVGRKNRIWLT